MAERAERGDRDGQPRVHTSADQSVSKYAIWLAASKPNQVVCRLIAADTRLLSSLSFPCS